MRIAILGVGGVGGYYGGLLARAGHGVEFLARGGNLEALRASGLEVRTAAWSETIPVRATDDPDRLGEVDLAIVSVKAYSVAEIAPVAARLARAGAVVVPLLNGVDAVDRLVEHGVPRAQVLGGVTYISAFRVAPGIVARVSPFQRVLVGEPAGGVSDRATRIARVFEGAGVDAAASDDIVIDLWRKWIFFTALSAACGLARAPIGPVRDAPFGRELLARAVGETAAVGRARGVRLDADEEVRAIALIDGLPIGMKPSLVLDLEHGGPTELDTLSGAVARLGREVGVATPVHDTAVAALAAGAGSGRRG